MYNNTNYKISYSLPKQDCELLNMKYGVSIFKCKNDDSGYVNPHEAFPLIFRFAPITSELYNVNELRI